MKMIKIASVPVICSILLSGCSEEKYDVMKNMLDYTTTSERLLYSSTKSIEKCANANNPSMHGIYFPFFDALHTRRTNANTQLDSSFPFCDSMFQLQIVEYSVVDECKITTTYKNITGTSLYDVCAMHNGNKTQDPQKPNQAPKQVNVVTPELYDQLIAAVKTCKRTANSVMDKIKPNAEISDSEFTDIQQMIISCKQYQLENAVQGH